MFRVFELGAATPECGPLNTGRQWGAAVATSSSATHGALRAAAVCNIQLILLTVTSLALWQCSC